jgi:hypothetical protein
MSEADLFMLVRGPLFHAALAIFIFGNIIKFFEILMLGHKPDYAEARGSAVQGGIRTIFSRFIPDAGIWQRATITVIAGYMFHLGLFTVIFLFAPHVLIFQDLLGLKWKALPTQIIDAATLLTMLALLILLMHRLRDPVRCFLSRPCDYLVWSATMLPLITGYLAFHRFGIAPQTLIAVHIFSVEFLLIIFPFTSLTHAFTLFLARYYTGFTAGHRGINA